MSLINRIITHFVANVLALIGAVYWIPGIAVSGSWVAYAKIALVLTVLNMTIKPILKLILSPFIFITLGLGIIVVNALVLYVLDILMNELTITGLYPLVYATLLISVVNVVIVAITRRKTTS